MGQLVAGVLAPFPAAGHSTRLTRSKLKEAPASAWRFIVSLGPTTRNHQDDQEGLLKIGQATKCPAEGYIRLPEPFARVDAERF